MKVSRWLEAAIGGILLVCCALSRAEPVAIDDIKFAALPGNEFEIKLQFSGPPPTPQGYSIESPARLVFDFEGAESALREKKYALSFENAQSAVVVGTKSRTRLIVNLQKAMPYQTNTDGNVVTITVGGESTARTEQVATKSADRGAVSQVGTGSSIVGVDFKRSDDGAGMVTVDLSDTKAAVDTSQVGKKIIVSFYRTTLPQALRRKLDVGDFATPIKTVDSQSDGPSTKIIIDAAGEYDYLAYQADRQFVVSVKPLTKEELDDQKSKFAYTGKKLSLNFQDIEVRSVLQLIADFTELNLVASDTVTGNITLRLQNVPWDQALDIVLKAKGLDKRQDGNVLLVAPTAEIAEQERLKVEANKQLVELAPLVTEYIRVRYADARKLFDLFDSEGGGGGGGGGGSSENATSSILSLRGNAIVDERTNTIIVTDVETKIEEFRRLIREIDIPIRQVEIEARIVIANTDFRKEMGVRWGAQALRRPGNSQVGVGGSLENFNDPNNPIQVFGGDPDGEILVNQDALNVDLGVLNPAGSFAIELLTNNTFIDLELSVLENSGGGEIVSQPKVLTGDKQKATIKSGVQIPYLTDSSAGNTTVQFKDAVLKLDVTPQITPDNRIIMDLAVNQDSVGSFVPSGRGGTVPSINVTELITQALVGDGQTLVLGGVFTMETAKGQEKVPVLGDIPFVGRLFRRDLTNNTKKEILIFITPRILDDALLDK
ncbi:MAG: type IV pilus secretin PilQ [Porticoccaceae bacterium]